MLRNVRVGDTNLQVCLRQANADNHSAAARSALARLAGANYDADIKFPHRTTSLAHSGRVAVAAVAKARQGLVGVGVDFEPEQIVRDAMARFFLSSSERCSLEVGDTTHLLRLWTVKEALYKATPDNGQVVFVDLIVRDSRASSGTAIHRARSHHLYHYTTFHIAGGWMAVATCFHREVSNAA